MHLNFQTTSFLMTLEMYAPQFESYGAFFSMTLEMYTLQLSNCFLLNDSWEICTATFKLLPSKWLLRDVHHNFQTASPLMTLEIYTMKLSNCFLLNDSREICTATFKLLPSKWLLREMHRNFQTAFFSMILEKYAPQLLNCFLLNDSRYIYIYIYIYIWGKCTEIFKLLPSQWFLRNMHRNFRTASFSMTLKKYALQLSNCFLVNDSWGIYTLQLSHCFP